MADDRDDLIRSRAYELWEAEGSPHGRHDDHWAQASREVVEAQEEAKAEPSIEVASPDESSAAAEAALKSGGGARRARKAAAVPAPAAPKGRRKKDG